MPKSGTQEQQQQQPPPGYPTGNAPTGKKSCCPKTRTKGGRDRDRGFFEGCLFVLCCCWLCEVCLEA